MEQLVATLMAGFLTRGASGEVMQADWQKRALDASFLLAKQIIERNAREGDRGLSLGSSIRDRATLTQPSPKEDHQHERPHSRARASGGGGEQNYASAGGVHETGG